MKHYVFAMLFVGDFRVWRMGGGWCHGQIHCKYNMYFQVR